MTAASSGQTLGGKIRDARVAAGLALREVARQIDRAPSYLNDIEHDRRVPSEAVLRQICALLTLDINEMLTIAGRASEGTEEYLKANPTAGVLLRRVSDAGLGEEELKKLLSRAEKIIRDRDKNSET
jgi:transcriptional regulator with XRE-family HTH domain